MRVHFGVIGNGIVKNNALLNSYLQSYSQQDVAIEQLSAKLTIKTTLQQSLKNRTFRYPKVDYLIGWGRKKSFEKASLFARILHKPILTLEDGFLRSLDTGQASRYACSVVIDHVGIYFDAKSPSYLEQLICQTHLDQIQIDRAIDLIDKIVSNRLSKYNTTPKQNTLKNLNIDNQKTNILLIDQVAGDQSIKGAGANEKTFADMLKTAEQNHPNATLWIKAHPANPNGYLTKLDLPKNCQIIRESVNPIALLELMDEIYTVSSHMGFEALMLQANGRANTVHCFGVAWYAGWGLTDDSYLINQQNLCYKNAVKRRQNVKKPTIFALFHACYLSYCHYANPATGKACDIEQAIDWLVTNRDWRDKLPKNLTLYHVSFWKWRFINQFLQATAVNFAYKPRLEPRTLTKIEHIKFPKKFPFLVWGFAKKQQLCQKNFATQSPIFCMEDGFIRSNGLGADLIEPLSVVLDKTGIYYNATCPSDLEDLINQQKPLTKLEILRVKKLQKTLLEQQVSKYNVGQSKRLTLHTDKPKILVVGQVEDDMSVRLCASDICDNLSLLKQVRADNPHAYIIYKPHPDVQAGLRTGKIAESDMQRLADKIELTAKIADCLDVVDEVHTISSLTGFEALLRGKRVTCYGLPFYAGWGLTIDKAQNQTANATKQRRQHHNLTLEQLIYATLIAYPMYHIPDGFGLAQVEDVIGYLYPKQGEKQEQKSNRSLFSQLKNKAKPVINHKFMQARHLFLQSNKRKSL